MQSKYQKKVDKNVSQDKKTDNPFVQIEELKITHQSEMAANQKDMAAIRAQLSEINVLGKPDLHYSQNKEILPAAYIP